MFPRIITIAMLAIGLAACKHHSHEHEHHDHHHHEEVSFQYAAYTNDLELYARADAFVVGETANVLSHFSTLPDFRALEEGKITAVLSVDGTEIHQTLDEPTHKGIYSFEITPEVPGKGTLKFEVTNSKGNFEVVIPDVIIFPDHHSSHQSHSSHPPHNGIESTELPQTNIVTFTKEQSWKTEFTTGLPKTEPFGQVIRTTALVQPAQGSEMLVAAKTAGIVLFAANNIVEGKDVAAGQILFTITGSGLSENNISVRYAEAKSNYEKARADYDRAKELAKDKIVSEKDFLSYKNQYETTKTIFDNLNKNTGESGQAVTTPLSGFIKQVFIKNGSFVEAGHAVLTVSQNKDLMLSAGVPQRYAHVLATIQTANIRNTGDNRTYTLEELNGKVLSYGKAANSDNYLLPVTIRIDNKGSFVPGSFVEVYLKTVTNNRALTVPVTAIIEEQGNYFVWVQVTPELFEKREVRIGGTDGLHVEITSGLTANERIVTRGAMLIKLVQSTGTIDAHSGHVH